MKKILTIGIWLCLLVLIIGNVSASESINSNETSTGLFKKTFLSGMIINPIEDNGTITAQALQVFYYEPGIFVNNAGVVKGLTTISFSKSNFILVWTPGPFEMIGYVLGMCKDFTIHE